jgi:hypothetical protein
MGVIFVEKNGKNGAGKKNIEYDTNEGGCWICNSHRLNSRGYPQISVPCLNLRKGVVNDKHLRSNRYVTVVRYLYGLKYGVVLRDMSVEHLCGDKRCVNIEHLCAKKNSNNSSLKRVEKIINSCVGRLILQESLI